jgi:hypothetical protein
VEVDLSVYFDPGSVDLKVSNIWESLRLGIGCEVSGMDLVNDDMDGRCLCSFIR